MVVIVVVVVVGGIVVVVVVVVGGIVVVVIATVVVGATVVGGAVAGNGADSLVLPQPPATSANRTKGIGTTRMGRVHHTQQATAGRPFQLTRWRAPPGNSSPPSLIP